jgi:hypothetical protein
MRIVSYLIVAAYVMLGLATLFQADYMNEIEM